MSNGASRSKPYVRDAVFSDCFDLAPRLRSEDVQEIKYASGSSPLTALEMSYNASSKCWAVVFNEKVIALFGVCKQDTWGVPWMLASDELKDIRKSFLRECREYVQKMGEGCAYLTNFVWIGNEVHIKWLHWLGFKFLEPVEYGKANMLFRQFYMEFR